MRVREGLHGLHLLHAKARQRGRGDHRVQRRRFQLVADRPVDGLRFQEVVGVDRLWRAFPAFDGLLEQGLLCRPIGESCLSRYGYYAVLPERKRRQRLVDGFVDWLQAELQAGGA